MDNFISQEKVLYELAKAQADKRFETNYDFAILYDNILHIPAVDIQPVVHARWYWDAYKYDWCCGNCYHPANHSVDWDDAYKKPSFKFCPHCGANMEGEK